MATAYLRVRALPFSSEVWDFIRAYDRVYVVEQNRDGQLYSLLRMECESSLVTKLHSICLFDGLPLDARSVSDSIRAREGASR